MYIKQADLFREMRMDLVKEVMDITSTKSYKEGDLVFSEADQATYFYILLAGQIKLSIGEPARVVYTVDHGGEAFGWSSLTGRDVYSASALCVQPTTVLEIHKEKFHRLMDKDPAHGLIFFKQLASMLGHRLVESYKIISEAAQGEASPSLHVGRAEESEAAV